MPRARIVLRLAQAGILLAVLAFTSSCDFMVRIHIQNSSVVPIAVRLNEAKTPAVVAPGEDVTIVTGVNETLRRVQVWDPEHPADVTTQEFSRRRGYDLYLTVTGPPLSLSVREKGY